jgi:hypothetical protein
LAAPIIDLTAGGAEGGATARPLGSSVAWGTAALALDELALDEIVIKHVPATNKIVPRLGMKPLYRHCGQEA